MITSCFEVGEMILVTNGYTPIDLLGKIQIWAHIRYVLSCHPFLPWIVVGDFNSVLILEDKRGGLAHLGPSSELLHENLDHFHIFDVKPLNGIFMWNNLRGGENAILERLDRFIVPFFWNSGNLFFSSKIFDWQGFDFWPIKISTSFIAIPKSPPFKFKVMWL